VFKATINEENLEETSFCMSGDSGLDLSRVDEEDEEETPAQTPAGKDGVSEFDYEDSLDSCELPSPQKEVNYAQYIHNLPQDIPDPEDVAIPPPSILNAWEA
jgi:RNA recognition motif-containing protein